MSATHELLPGLVILKRSGLREAITDDHLSRTISEAVVRARHDHGLAKPGQPLPDDARPLAPQRRSTHGRVVPPGT